MQNAFIPEKHHAVRHYIQQSWNICYSLNKGYKLTNMLTVVMSGFLVTCRDYTSYNNNSLIMLGPKKALFVDVILTGTIAPKECIAASAGGSRLLAEAIYCTDSKNLLYLLVILTPKYVK